MCHMVGYFSPLCFTGPTACLRAHSLPNHCRVELAKAECLARSRYVLRNLCKGKLFSDAFFEERAKLVYIDVLEALQTCNDYIYGTIGGP